MSDKNKPKKKLLPKFDALREIETKYLTLFESFHDIILMLDRMGNIININLRGEQLTGYLQSELLKMNVFQDLLVPEDHAIIRQVIQDTFKGRESGYEVRWTTKEGKIIHFDGLTVPLLSAHGEVLSTLCTLRDITARKLPEGALRKAQLHTESILASVADTYILFDRQWRYIYVNDAAVRAICRPREEILGRTLWELYPDIVGTELAHQYHRAMDERLPVVFEFYYSATDTWWENRFYPAPEGLTVFATNITARKNADKLQQASLRFLKTMHKHTEIGPLLEELASEIKDYTGCDSVAIRVLDEAGNIPYHAYTGFSTKFVDTESPLSVKSDHCMCIYVIKGTSNSRLPFYTKGGSFYMNGTTRFLATVSEEEKGKTRNVCNKEGYESVALVPFSSGGRILGLIHVADHRENMVPLKMVEQLENLALQLGMVFQRANSEDALRKSEARYRHLFDNMLEGYAYCKILYVEDAPKDIVFIQVNDAFKKLTGLKDVVGKKVGEIMPGIYESNPELLRYLGKAALTGKPERFETYSESFGGWLDISAYSHEKEHFIAVFDNITERKRTEEALRVSERQYRQLVDNALVGVYKATLEGKFLYANDAMARIFECENADEMLQLPVVIRYKRPEDRELFLNILKERGKVPYYEIEVPTKTGKLKTIVISAVLDDGFITGMVTDITERKKAEDELRLFKNLINQVNDEIFVVDPETGCFLDVNAQACSNLGYELEDLRKMCVWDIETHIPNIFLWKAHVDEVKNKGYMILEGRQRRKDGSTYPVEVNVKYIALEKGDYIVAVARDITERKKAEKALQKSEEKYKDLFDSTLDGIYQVDSDGVFILMNPAGAKMFGYESPDEIIGRKGLEYWSDPRDGDVFRAELKIKKSVSGYHMRLKKKNGEPIELETSSTIKEDEKGAFLGIEGILRDVTERKELEAQLRHSQKMEAVGTLAGGIAHDFNNVLNVIIGYGSMVLDKLEDKSLSKEQMNEVLAAAERAVNLTKRLLVFSRRQLAEVRPTTVNELITNIQKMLVRLVRESIDFKLDLSGTRLVVMADAGQIEQVLLNLVTNANDAMPNGGRLLIGTGLQEIDEEFITVNGYGIPGMYALITVADTGHGMDVETQKKIFEPFFTTKGIGEGTGLGLAISYGIIKQHNGYIKVYSKPGQGTEFKIYLPLIEESASLERKIAASDAVEGGNETVLVAEDDASLKKLIKIVLESFGYSVIAAVDGEDAITKFMESRESIRLVMLDMIMPKKNGKEVSEELRKASPDIKILFLSGYTMDLIKDEYLTESGFDFIHKPIRPQDLLRKVREVLDK